MSTKLASGVECLAIYRLIGHFNLWKRIDKQGVRNEHINNRFCTVASNGKISIVDQSRLATEVGIDAVDPELFDRKNWHNVFGQNLSASTWRKVPY